MKNVISTVNALKNALILSKVTPNDLDSRIVHVCLKLLSVFLAVTKKNNNVELILLCVQLFETFPTHVT